MNQTRTVNPATRACIDIRFLAQGKGWELQWLLSFSRHILVQAAEILYEFEDAINN